MFLATYPPRAKCGLDLTTGIDTTDGYVMGNLKKMVSGHYSPIAKAGFTASSLYDKYRPPYPSHAVDHILAKLSTTEGEDHILELGAGTGELTKMLSAFSASSVIFAVEPHSEMRAFIDNQGSRARPISQGTNLITAIT